MVLRIIRYGVCRPSKYRRPKFNALYRILRSTSSDQSPDEVAKRKNCPRTIDATRGSQQHDEPNITRPTIVIAHTSVFDAGKDDDKNTETLLESLQKKLASQAGLKHNLAIDEAQNNEEVKAGTDNQKDHYSKDGLEADTIWHFANINDSDISKDDKLLQRPEPIDNRGERRPFIDPPDLKTFHNLYRFEKQTEDQKFDKLAEKYLTMEKDLVDKRLAEDMERLGLPINTSEAMKPTININVSCEKDTLSEADVSKSESQQGEVISSNPQYYEQASWCNQYFKPSGEIASDIASSEVPDEMLQLNCCLNLNPYDRMMEMDTSNEKLGYEEHGDVLPFHLLQCMEFSNLDLSINNDKINPPFENLNINESLPIHLYLQRNLVDDVAATPNTIETVGQYDLTSPFEELEGITEEPLTDVFHSLMVQDTDVSKFDYTLPSPVALRKASKAQTKKETSHPILEPDTIIQIEAQTLPQTEIKQKADLKQTLTHTNIIRPKVAEPEQKEKRLPQRVETIVTNDKTTDTIEQPKPISENELTNFINAKIMEQMGARTPLQNTIKPQQRMDTLVQMSPPQSTPTREVSSVVHTKVLEQLSPLQNIVNPHEKMNRLVHMSPQCPHQSHPSQDVTSIIHSKVLEQMRAPSKFNQTTHSLKGLDAVVQMQTQGVSKIGPEQNVAHTEALLEKQGVKDTQIAPKPQKESNSENFPQELQAKQTSRETETIVRSCVQTVPNNEAQKVAHQESVEDVANKLSLDLNLSLSELLRRVRARNRMQYVNDVKTKFQNMSTLHAEKRCPPSDRPQCPPPPDCTKPCPPPPKPKCPPEPPKCPPEPPKCPPEPPKCPPPKKPKCPPDPPKCPPDPPKCPPEPKCPCPCPPPPKCPPEPPKCPCQAIDPDDPVTIPPYLTLLDTGSCYLKNLRELIKRGYQESRNLLFYDTNDFRIPNLNLNRVKDFEPWTPIPSWPFPVNHKKRKLQCPYHGCPYHKPGPVRPNCPELPCAGFPKRLCCSEANIIDLFETE